MSLAKEFPGCGHLRFLPTRYKKCPVCREEAIRARQALREHENRTAAALKREAAEKRAARMKRIAEAAAAAKAHMATHRPDNVRSR